MHFDQIEIENFRQYYGINVIDLHTEKTKNIILLGGKNGYGKTNFLLSIVWCLYGEKISQVDDNFKKEIRKEKNYSSFMNQSLNWTAKREMKNEFSVSIKVSNLEIPLKNNEFDYRSLTIKRSFNVTSFNETLLILDANNKSIYENDEDKINFIDDFIIPIDAAKFVFFDAEKISEVANLSMKDEGSFINDALNKVLGLDIYNQLISDLNNYIQSLQKNNLSGSAEDEVNDIEITIKNRNKLIEDLENENASLNKQINTLKGEVDLYNSTINKSSPQDANLNRDELIKSKKKIEDKIATLEDQFNILGEVIPLVILSNKLHQVKNHLDAQEENELEQAAVSLNLEKVEQFIESLFNDPPQPKNSTLTFKDKVFFYDKAKNLGEKLFGNVSLKHDLNFEHDFTNADKKLIDSAITIIGSYEQKIIEDILSQLNIAENTLNDIDKTLNKFDADQVDEYISELIIKRQRLEQEIEDAVLQIGSNNESIKRECNELERKEKRLDYLLKRIKVSNENQERINTAQNYIEVLKEFINTQKQSKKVHLEKNILSELKKANA